MTMHGHHPPVLSGHQPRLVVASVPSGHVYVQHIASERNDGISRLDDPDPDEPTRSAIQRWWPPVMLQPDWIRSQRFDVFHVQFGFDAWDPDDLSKVISLLKDRGTPLVYTAHDLRNPHHQDRALHDAQLDVLVPGADRIITLTSGAAAEIQKRWGREAVVLAHPHVVDFPTIRRLQKVGRVDPATFRVGLHLKSLRASMDPLRILPTLIDAVRSLPGGVLQVNGHRDVLSSNGERRHDDLADFLRHHERRGALELQVHDFLPDAELWAYLASLDVSVLPYRFGTHSGWLEACRDLGTTVVAPTCGYYADQGPVTSYVHDEDSFDAASLRQAIEFAFAHPSLGVVTPDERRAQRAGIAAAHRELYQELSA
ncbi:conserved hypothetical protein [metagenome]|uniref:Glycosyltransferase subfamily 4-like N-terminal domain-containing protein n=1 Tax=metagenome TaxID=256318 RepID=A0A2P2C7I3_9ZZZZ